MPNSTPIVRKYTLVVEGDDPATFDEALAEATRLMKIGNVEGHNSNQDGGFYFRSTDIMHDSERPAR